MKRGVGLVGGGAQALRRYLPSQPPVGSALHHSLSSLVRGFPSRHICGQATTSPFSSFLQLHRRRFHGSLGPLRAHQTHEEENDGGKGEGEGQASSYPASFVVPDSFAVVYVGGRQYKVTKGMNPSLPFPRYIYPPFLCALMWLLCTQHQAM